MQGQTADRDALLDDLAELPIMLLSAVVNAWSTHRFIKSARRADGIVKELSHGPAHPLIEFHLPSGEAHEFPANGGSPTPKGTRSRFCTSWTTTGFRTRASMTEEICGTRLSAEADLLWCFSSLVR